MSAHWLDTIKAIGRDVAFLFWTPRPTTWRRTPPLLLEAPKQPVEEIATEQQTTGEISMAKIFEGMFDGVPHYYGPPGTRMWTSMEKPYRRPSTTGKIGPQNTGPMSPIPPTPRDTDPIPQLSHENRDWSELDTARKLRMQQALEALDQQRREAPKLPRIDLTGDALHPQQSRSRFADVPTAMNLDGQMSRVIAQVDRGRESQKLAWLYEEIPPTPPVLAPLGTGDLAVSDRVAQPGGNIAEIRMWEEADQPSSAFDVLLRSNSTTLEVPTITRQIAEKHKKESEA